MRYKDLFDNADNPYGKDSGCGIHSNKAIFLNKDNTLVHQDQTDIDSPLIILAAKFEALKYLQAEGYKIIVVSNESEIARGFFKEDSIKKTYMQLCQLLDKYGIYLDDFYYCPHLLDGIISDYAVACTCRKPQPGLLLRAAREHDIDVSSSWMLGDVLDDIEAGNRAGCKSILIDSADVREWYVSFIRKPHSVVKDLEEAVYKILSYDSYIHNKEII